MKLLFDQNLSPRLVERLAEPFAGSEHVREVGLARASDQEVWDYAVEHGLTVVSKDTDFMQMSFLFGAPPKVICIRRGNCSTAEIEGVLRSSVAQIREFVEAEELSYLILHQVDAGQRLITTRCPARRLRRRPFGARPWRGRAGNRLHVRRNA